MELETVGRVAVGNLGLQVGRQVDDMDSAEWTFLRADTASNAETFRDKGNFGVGCDFDTQLAGTDYRAGFFALLTTFSRATLKGGVRKCSAGGGAHIDADGDDHTPCRC